MNLQVTSREIGLAEEKDQNKADRVEITFYTDPLCCWSWAFEPQWRKLQYQFKDQLVFRYVMTGMLPSWKNYSDPFYSVNRPQQMGPVWLEAASTSGMTINSKIWVNDPPASSYPACIAVKAIELQSGAAAVKYLRMLREAVMVEEKNIAKQDVLFDIADRLVNKYPSILDLHQFASDLTNDNGLESFRRDWHEAQNCGISRTPTLILRSQHKPAIMLTGYRPYPALLEAVKQISPNIEPTIEQIGIDHYRHFWSQLTDREIQEIL